MRSSLALALALGSMSLIAAADVVPTDGMVITTNTTFVPGTYNLANGITIGASNVELNMNGAVLMGAGGVTYGVTSIGNSHVTIHHGAAHGYYYGVRVEGGTHNEISDCDLSDNYVDPNSLGGSPPFLAINVGPNLPNFTNLGGGLYLKSTFMPTVANNLMRNQENGMDLYSVTLGTISGNDCSYNTGWGIHLNDSTHNTIQSNIADYCTRVGLNDSAGFLLVNASSLNTIVGNSFRFSGDGFFIGNEAGCPSNANVIMGNDGSGAGANAFEATFSSGNFFLDNIANGSNYGFWLGYSHDGNVIDGNEIRANNANGIEIEHGQNNTISNNLIAGNGGKGIVLRTDFSSPFPPGTFPCLNLPNQSLSTGYTITANIIKQNFAVGIELINTTNSTITNNLIGGNAGGTTTSNGAGNVWSSAPSPGRNIVGGSTLGGNWWGNYAGVDTDRDGLGDTLVPYTNGGLIAAPGDPHPLIGDPDIGGFDNPTTFCARKWIDLGLNKHVNGSTFQTSNGTHYATNGTDLYLLEGSNGVAFDLFQPGPNNYQPKANVPEGVEDGGDLQFGGGLFYATVGLSFNAGTGTGKGPKLYAYNPATNSWSAKASTIIAGKALVNEALAYDPVNARLYATITNFQNGADPLVKRKLAIYDPSTNQWTGLTSSSGVDWNAATEAEHLDGKIYVWRGGFAGGAVNGGDSYLNVYDIATDTWSTTPTLQASGILPGFRSGAIDVWGVALTADPARHLLLVLGGEANKLVYVFDVAAQSWRVTPTAIYDGGWGDAFEYVSASNRIYQVDGRNSGNTPQGTAMLVPLNADLDGNGSVGAADLALLLGAWGRCADACCPGDIDENGATGPEDLAILLGAWTG